MKICNCVLPHTSGPDICKNCGNNNEYPEMVSRVSQPLYGNSTSIINLDYYHELKEKADKWDEKETPVKPIKDKNHYNVCSKCNGWIEDDLGKLFEYCPNCGQKIDNV